MQRAVPVLGRGEVLDEHAHGFVLGSAQHRRRGRRQVHHPAGSIEDQDRRSRTSSGGAARSPARRMSRCSTARSRARSRPGTPDGRAVPGSRHRSRRDRSRRRRRGPRSPRARPAARHATRSARDRSASAGCRGAVRTVRLPRSPFATIVTIRRTDVGAGSDPNVRLITSYDSPWSVRPPAQSLAEKGALVAPDGGDHQLGIAPGGHHHRRRERRCPRVAGPPADDERFETVDPGRRLRQAHPGLAVDGRPARRMVAAAYVRTPAVDQPDDHAADDALSDRPQEVRCAT